MKRTLIFSDLTASFLAFLLAFYLRDKGPFLLLLAGVQPIAVYLAALPFATLLLLLSFYHFALYRIKGRETALLEIYNLLQATAVWSLLLMSFSYLIKYDFSRIILVLYVVLTLLFVLFFRLLLRHFLKEGWKETRIVILGKGDLEEQLRKRIKKINDLGYRLVGSLTTTDSKELDTFLARKKADELWIILPKMRQEKVLELVNNLSNPQITVRVYSDMFSSITGQVAVDDFERLPTFKLARISLTSWQKVTKRLVDLLLASLLLLVTLPLWLVIALAIKIDSKGKIIFCQKRIGLNGKPFLLYKFRTMKENVKQFAPPPRNSNDPRITRVGKILRRTSLDELPQLINIIKGEMSLVGPRPEMPFIVKKYKPWQRKRLEVKPGLTGLWQIVGRKDLPLHENLEYDFYYITNQSLLFDLAIMLKTVVHVITGKGAY